MVIPRVSSRVNKGVPPIRFGYSDEVPQAQRVWVQQSANFQEVMQLEGSEREVWLSAMKHEFDSMTRLRVFSLAELPDGKTPVSCKWLFKVKQTP